MYVVYGAIVFAKPSLLWWLQSVKSSGKPICDDPRKQLVDVTRERDWSVVFKDSFVSFLEKQCHYAPALRLQGNPTGYDEVEQPLMLAEHRLARSF